MGLKTSKIFFIFILYLSLFEFFLVKKNLSNIQIWITRLLVFMRNILKTNEKMNPFPTFKMSVICYMKKEKKKFIMMTKFEISIKNQIWDNMSQ